MELPKVVIVHYKLWPGLGIKGVAHDMEAARQMVELIRKNYRQSGFEQMPDTEGFQLIELEIDVLQIAGRTFVVGDGKPKEILNAVPAPEVRAVPRTW
jgi:hypothetical protein